MKTRKLYMVCSLVFLFASALMGQQLHVPGEYSSIQAAINAANPGDTVLVAEGTYYENINFMSKSITVASEFIIDGKATHIAKTIIDGSRPVNPEVGSVVTIIGVPNSNAALKGLTITGGSGSFIGPANKYLGGAIMLVSGATIEHNIIRDNGIVQDDASNPGISGIFISSGTLIVRHNKILRNACVASDISAGGGIGVLVFSPGVTIRINDNIIADNSLTCPDGISALGGGIEIETEHANGTDIQINNNTITGNALHSATSMGGGVYIEFWEDLYDGTSDLKVNVFNNLITNNYSQDKGGGIAVFSMGGVKLPDATYPVIPLIMNNTLIDNVASDGAGIFAYDVNLLLLNNILWDKTDENCREIFQDYLPAVHFRTDLTWPFDINGETGDTNDGTLYVFNNCMKGGEDELQGTWLGENNVEAYPMINPALFKPLPKSPCLGTGTASVVIDGEMYDAPDFDFYNNPRPEAETDLVDMGAVMSDELKRVGLRNQFGWKATKESKLKSASLENTDAITHNTYDNIRIYPNPLTTTALIQSPNQSIIQRIELVDITGKVVCYMDKVNSNRITLERIGLQNGIYILKVHADKVYVQKVIIE